MCNKSKKMKVYMPNIDAENNSKIEFVQKSKDNNLEAEYNKNWKNNNILFFKSKSPTFLIRKCFDKTRSGIFGVKFPWKGVDAFF